MSLSSLATSQIEVGGGHGEFQNITRLLCALLLESMVLWPGRISARHISPAARYQNGASKERAKNSTQYFAHFGTYWLDTRNATDTASVS